MVPRSHSRTTKAGFNLCRQSISFKDKYLQHIYWANLFFVVSVGQIINLRSLVNVDFIYLPSTLHTLRLSDEGR